MNTERCSCGARDKNKCSKESEHNSGKLFLKENNKAFNQLTEKLWKENPEEMAEAQAWVKDFASKQETLPAEFQQILEDHISELYEK